VNVDPLLKVEPLPALSYASVPNARQRWSGPAVAALFLAAVALPSPFLIDEALRREAVERPLINWIAAISFYGCSTLALVLSVVSRSRFAKPIVGQPIPRARWIGEIAFLWAVLDCTLAILVTIYIVLPRFR
jgi:hypothetical protein